VSTSTENLQRPTGQLSLQGLSLEGSAQPGVSVATSPPSTATAIGVAVFTTGAPLKSLGFSREQLGAAGFNASPASTLSIPKPNGPALVAVGIGGASDLDAARVRDAAAAFARAVPNQTRLAFSLDGLNELPAEATAQAVVEGILLARYEYAGLGRERKDKALESIALVVADSQQDAARAGAARGLTYAKATTLARDLANTPHSHLSATHFAELAAELGERKGFEVEVFDKEALRKINCGGLLSVNAGSAEPPRMIKLVYRPKQKSAASLALVGKGVMYDSGGISLKPSDPVHARMKNDMSGAAAVLAAVAELPELGCPNTVTGYLMCTDNMPSGTATALGDVFTTHGGKTVEVFDTDAEGRLVMCDALELAVDEQHDAIIDIATLTGSCARALGSDIAGLFGNDEALIKQVETAARATGELVWQLPLHRPYREILESDVADLRNCGPVGKPDALVAALYLAEFVGDVPWAHIDICGTAWNEKDHLWRRAGCSGFGARLLLELIMHFTPGARPARH
jgi:leucyl aminopeptidase